MRRTIARLMAAFGMRLCVSCSSDLIGGGRVNEIYCEKCYYERLNEALRQSVWSASAPDKWAVPRASTHGSVDREVHLLAEQIAQITPYSLMDVKGQLLDWNLTVRQYSLLQNEKKFVAELVCLERQATMSYATSSMIAQIAATKTKGLELKELIVEQSTGLHEFADKVLNDAEKHQEAEVNHKVEEVVTLLSQWDLRRACSARTVAISRLIKSGLSVEQTAAIVSNCYE